MFSKSFSTKTPHKGVSNFLLQNINNRTYNYLNSLTKEKMAQGKTKIKSKLPANAKHKSNKTNKQNSAFKKRKSEFHRILYEHAGLISLFSNFLLRRTCTEKNGWKVEDSRGYYENREQEERRRNEIKSNFRKSRHEQRSECSKETSREDVCSS